MKNFVKEGALEVDNEKLVPLKDLILLELEQYEKNVSGVHPYDIAEQLLEIREESDEEYLSLIKIIPHDLFADILSEFPDYVQEEIAELLSTKDLADIASNMDTDDAASFIQNIQEEHPKTAQEVLNNFNEEDQELIQQLIAYDEDQAGAHMQSELFGAHLNEKIGVAIKRLKMLKEDDEIDNVWQVYLMDNQKKYLGAVSLEDLIIFEHNLKFSDIPIEKHISFSINHKADIKDAVEIVTNYNLNAIAVVDDSGRLIGRITSDDIYDIIQESATEQIFNLAGVNDDVEQDEDIFEIGKSRAMWLAINLVTAVAASLVIGMFDKTIQSIVALAVLMPIVASMGGNAGTQTLTVTVRKMALGDIEGSDARKTIYKEIVISLANGFIFALIIGIVAYFWFHIPLLGVVIALSMIINLISAGFFGSVIPLTLQKMDIDPAIGSTVLLTTVTDVVGFFSFLGLASIILL